MPSISLSKLSSRIGKKYVLKARTMKHYRHITNAEQAASNGDELRARRMSEQAIVDAQLARAKTDSGLSRLGAVEEKDAMQDLQREVERNR